jgi:putative tryptophan/tyrosine transport system substrate-binding protein
MRRGHAGALLVLSEPATAVHRLHIAEMAAKQRLPILVPNASSDAGGLIGYGTNLAEAVRRLAVYVNKIRKGANPADLPFEVFVRPELVVNLKTAHEIGIAIPSDVLKRADRVI